MANSSQSRKRARQAQKNNLHNASLRSMMRTYMKKMVAAIKEGNPANAAEVYKKVSSVVDRMASKGLIHKNKAARHKQRFNAQVRALSAK